MLKRKAYSSLLGPDKVIKKGPEHTCFHTIPCLVMLLRLRFAFVDVLGKCIVRCATVNFTQARPSKSSRRLFEAKGFLPIITKYRYDRPA